MHFFRASEAPLQTIHLDEVPDHPGPFCMSFGFDLGPLIDSIKRVGLIQPPLLRTNRGAIEIVTGYRRLMALKALNRTFAPCRMVSADEIGPRDCLLMNLHDNLATRRLNDVEKGMVIARLSVWVPQGEIVTTYLPLLGLRPDIRNLIFFQEIDKRADATTRRFIAEEGVSWRVVKMLSDLDAPSRTCLLSAISKLRFNINQQLQFIDYVIDLSRIENVTIPHMLNRMGLGETLSDPANRPQEAKAVLNRLRARRYPAVVAAERRFHASLADLNLPEGVRIVPSPFFEGEHFRLEVLFRRGDELALTLRKLSHINGLSRLKHPWDDVP